MSLSFFEGGNNDAQWVALALNGINLIASSLIVRSSKEGSRKKSLFKFIIFLLILVLILYYALREFYFLKNDRNANIIGWNIGYLVASAYLFWLLITEGTSPY